MPLFGPTSMPEMLLTTTGRKSGQPRSNALSFLRDGNRLLVIGSNFGERRHPAWSSNLLANPEASAAIGGGDIPITATLVIGEDRELRVFALSRR
jgi:deazaflavin-dependent oxidoreductase (nitroreductase family)